ncbi:MAG: hypothetical protein HFH85_20175 [Lachnospiraceae bacterium]|jgi:hypothetical protein|nr:hypothetical protein [Lachnospiraceae bacterium]
MVLRNSAIDEFAAYVTNNKKKITLFGAGTLLKSWISYVLEGYGLNDRVEMVIDNAPDKWGRQISLNGRRFYIDKVEFFRQKVSKDTVILITSSYFSTMIHQLDKMQELDAVECYIMPIMHITRESNRYMADFRMWQTEIQRIPKVIHYCWFGRNPIPDRNKRCMESWKKFCPDYEIVEWNEDNYNVAKNNYMKQAYDAQKYGYVPDYARIDILYRYGGIYLDTDVELVRSLDDLLYLRAYTSFEEYPTVNFGGGSGSEKGFPLLKRILDFRESIDFIMQDGSMNQDSCGYYESVPLREEGLRLDGTMQNIKGLTVLSSEYFHPKSSVTGLTNITDRTYSIHRFDWSWVGDEKMEEKLETHREYEEILGRMRESS